LRGQSGVPIWAACEDGAAGLPLAWAQVVHSIKENPGTTGCDSHGMHVSALFHSYLVEFNHYCCMAIF
jgi:hypothetical protein